MKALYFLAAVFLTGCSKQPPATTPAQRAFDLFVEAGCTAADDSGAGAQAFLEESMSDAAPPFFACLLEGGTITSCNVNCAGQ